MFKESDPATLSIPDTQQRKIKQAHSFPKSLFS